MDLVFEAGEVSRRADHLLVDAPILANQQGGRYPRQPAIQRSDLPVAHGHRIVHAVLFAEPEHWLHARIHGDADDLESLLAIPVLKVDEPRNLAPARTAPGRPEIEQYNLAFVVGQVERVAVDVSQREHRRQREIPRRGRMRNVGCVG